MRKLVRLTESQLHRVIKESVNRLLTELDWKTYASAGDKAIRRANNEKRPYIDDDEHGAYLMSKPSEIKAYDFNKAAAKRFNDKFSTPRYRQGGKDSEYDEYNYGAHGTSNSVDTHVNKRRNQNELIKGTGYDTTFGRSQRNTCANFTRHMPKQGWNVNDDDVYHYSDEDDADFSDIYPNEVENARKMGDKELSDFYNGKYKYQKGKGWQLK
jgi:hypothetical protein